MLRLLAILAVALGPSDVRADSGNPTITSDARADLLSIVFHLAGAFEYNQDSAVPVFRAAVDSAFANYREHPAIAAAARLRETYGVAFSAPMALAVHLTQPPDLKERTPLDGAPGMRAAWRPGMDSTRAFVDLLRGFYRDASVDTFLARTRGLSSRAVRDLRTLVEREGDFGWFDRYFGRPPTTRFIVIPSLLNGGAQYGPHYIGADGTDEAYAILGIDHWNAVLNAPQFTDETLTSLTHELAHSYCNPLVDANKTALDSIAAELFPLVSSLMERQAYGPHDLMYESLVRATVVRFMKTHGRFKEAAAQIAAEEAGGFYWLGELTDSLGSYETHRWAYPTFESFMPRIVSYFRRLPPRLPRLRDESEARRPKVIATTPADGESNVDPATQELIVRFDTPMDTTSRYQAIVPVRGDGVALVPKILGQHFDHDGKRLRVQMELAPQHEYEFAINYTLGFGYRSRSGVPALRRVVHFSTRR